MTRVAILGMGKSGQSAAKLALSLQYEVHCIDANTAAVQLDNCQHHYGIDFDVSCVDLLIISPGVPSNNPLVTRAIESDIPVTGELGFAAKHIQCPLLAITGTNGKSSTAFYTHQLLQQAGKRSFIGGNFGIALSEMALHQDQYDIGVVEISSYQMEFPNGFSPHSAVALNLTPDHLKRHGTMDVYAAMKRRVFTEQGPQQFSIVTKGENDLYPQNDAIQWWIGAFPGARIEKDQIQIKTKQRQYQLSLQGLQLLGKHNRQNLMAACLLVNSVHTDVLSLNLSTIQPLEHRLEKVPSQDGITWINDSKATNIEATIAGICGIAKKQILLLGGAGKDGADYKQLLPLLEQYAQHIICFGDSGKDIYQQLSNDQVSLHRSPNLAQAVRRAAALAGPDACVLLSPACASFDEFDDFEHRGRVFKQLIQDMKELS